jgi:hypothetical protein
VVAVECILTEEELQQKLVYWQKKLKLDNWEVVAKIVRGRNLSDSNNSGEVDYYMTTGYAIISLLDPLDYPDDAEWPYDMEKVLVHELCHLHGCYFRPEDEETLNFAEWERANETFARILVDMDRQVHGYPQPKNE